MVKKTIFTSLSPNVESDDVSLALKLLFRPSEWTAGEAIEKLENQFRLRFSSKFVYSFASGRSALYAILSSLKLAPEDEVLLQAYTCVAVPNAVLWAGLRPVYVDIGENSYNMSPEDLEKKITSRSRVLILQHTFGFPADLERILAIARKHQLFMIEDCAHSLGSRYQGREIGTFGDAAFFSFGRDKVISSVFGGMALTTFEPVGLRIKAFHDSLPFPSKFWTAKQLLHPIITRAASRWYDVCAVGRILLRISLASGLISRAVEKGERTGAAASFARKKMPNALSLLALQQLSKLERFNRHRRELASFYTEGLDDLELKLPREEQDLVSIYLRYCVQSSEASRILEAAKKSGIILGDWYTTSIAPRGVNYQKLNYDPSLCPVAETVAGRSFNLPTHINITKEDARRIVDFLQRYI